MRLNILQEFPTKKPGNKEPVPKSSSLLCYNENIPILKFNIFLKTLMTII